MTYRAFDKEIILLCLSQSHDKSLFLYKLPPRTGESQSKRWQSRWRINVRRETEVIQASF